MALPYESYPSYESRPRVSRSAKRLDEIIATVYSTVGRANNPKADKEDRGLYTHSNNKYALLTDGQSTFIITPRPKKAPGFLITAIIAGKEKDGASGKSLETSLAFFVDKQALAPTESSEQPYNQADFDAIQTLVRRSSLQGATRADVNRFNEDDYEMADIIMNSVEEQLGMHSGPIAQFGRYIASLPIIANHDGFVAQAVALIHR